MKLGRDAVRDPSPRASNWRATGTLDEIQRLGSVSDDEMAKVFNLGIGMIAVRFAAQIELTNLVTPSMSESPSCTLLFSGDAGALGFAKGEAHIELHSNTCEAQSTESTANTQLRWRAKPELGGKIATLAGRMVQGLAQQLSAQFFKRFEQAITHSTSNPMPQTRWTKIKNWLLQRFK